MATQTVVNDFAEQLAKGVHNFGTDTIKLFLTNTAPAATDVGIADITQIAYTNVAEGANPTIAIAVSNETDTILSADEQAITASGGAVATFRYYGLYNDTATSPADALICFWDHGSAVDLADGEKFTIKFNGVSTAGQILKIGVGSIA